MVYDMSDDSNAYIGGESGYAIHKCTEDNETFFELYTDDGRGNGDYICKSYDKYWIERIAYALDATAEKKYR